MIQIDAFIEKAGDKAGDKVGDKTGSLKIAKNKKGASLEKNKSRKVI